MVLNIKGVVEPRLLSESCDTDWSKEGPGRNPTSAGRLLGKENGGMDSGLFALEEEGPINGLSTGGCESSSGKSDGGVDDEVAILALMSSHMSRNNVGGRYGRKFLCK